MITISEDMARTAKGHQEPATEDEYLGMCMELDNAVREAMEALSIKYGIDRDAHELGIILNKLGCLAAEVQMNKDKQLASEEGNPFELLALKAMSINDVSQNHIVNVAITGFLYGIHFANTEMK
jgi:hypothetical protein